MIKDYIRTKQEKRIGELYYHWSYGILCIWCFVGLIIGLVLFIQSMSDSHWKHELLVAGIVGLSSVISGIYIKIIDDMEQDIFEKEFAVTREKVSRGEI